METQIRDDKAIRTQATIEAAAVCVLFTVALIFGLRAFVGALPRQMSEPVSWYGVPVVYLVGGLLLAKATGVQRDIRLLGAGLNWRNAILFSGLAVVIPIAWQLLLMLGFRVFAPDLLSQMTGGAVSTGHIIRSLIGSPIGEEVLIRGWLLSWLAARVKTEHRVLGCTLTTANLLTSLTFAAMHLVSGVNWFTPLSLLGVVWVALMMGRAKERTGGLLLPMICHAMINALDLL